MHCLVQRQLIVDESRCDIIENVFCLHDYNELTYAILEANSCGEVTGHANTSKFRLAPLYHK